MMPKKLTLLLLLVVFTGYVNANSAFQAHSDIISSVQNYLAQQLISTQDIETKIKMGHIDSRLKLAHCDKPLNVFSNNQPSFGSKLSIQVKCTGKKPWSLYIPVTIERLAKIFVAAQPIAKGSLITGADIQLVSRDINKIRGRYIKNKMEIIGKIPKRRIKLGAVFNPRYLRLPIIIKKGDIIDIIAESHGLKISMSGKAINNGAKGQKINVKNLSSNRIIQAIVQNAGSVRIAL